MAKYLGVETTNNGKFYFISYNKANRDWAKWIGGTLEENGYSVYLQAWDIAPGDDFIERMNSFLKYSKWSQPSGSSMR